MVACYSATASLPGEPRKVISKVLLLQSIYLVDCALNHLLLRSLDKILNYFIIIEFDL
jgi:hypothetical protein